MSDELLLITLFIVKHFICDFPTQRPYHYLNKGKYGHFGGIEHALIHGVGTYIVCAPILGIGKAYIVAIIDMVVHYHIDWAKVKINNRYELKADNSKWFWILLGVDQMLHYLTYVGIILWI